MAHDGSDIDLVIRNENLIKMPFKTLALLRETITYSNIPILVQLSDWATLPKYFHEEILKIMKCCCHSNLLHLQIELISVIERQHDL